jgi:hypothetical protein
MKESLDSGLNEHLDPFGNIPQKFADRVKEIKAFYVERGFPDDSALEEWAAFQAYGEFKQTDLLNSERAPSK